MATLAVQKVSRAGLNLTTGAAAGGGDDFANDGKTILFVDNGGGAPINLTFTLASDPHADEPTQSTTQTNVAVTNGESRYVGPFPTNKFGTSVAVAYSAVTTVTVAAFTF